MRGRLPDTVTIMQVRRTAWKERTSAAATACHRDAATSGKSRIAAAATAGTGDAATPGEDLIAAAATAGQKDAATPLEQRSEDPEQATENPSRSAGPGRREATGPLATRGCPRLQYL